jgi:hypothetical protein
MIRPAFISALAIAALAACAAPVPKSSPVAQAGSILALRHCPERIAEAAAWVNHMPGTGRAPRELVIGARMENAKALALLFKAADSTKDMLVLEIRASETAPVPGRLAYREPVPDPLYSKILFRCRGGEVFTIAKIEMVY